MPIEFVKLLSLETLGEAEDWELEILHPGGLQITRELAELCRINPTSRVLDVASGTGESACFLAERFACVVRGIDASNFLVVRAREKAMNRGISVEFKKADAHNLPYDANTFDAVISECTTCLLDKEVAISEMTRVAKPGGHVGIHDLCWKEDTHDELKRRLSRTGAEDPETLYGWKGLFERAGLEEVIAVDRSFLMPVWGKDLKRKRGIITQLKILMKAARRSGFKGLRRTTGSTRILQDVHIGYGIIVGRKRPACQGSSSQFDLPNPWSIQSREVETISPVTPDMLLAGTNGRHIR